LADDVVLSKVQIIERCLKRVAEESGGDHRNLRENITKQASILLNLERACQAAIDLGMRIVKLRSFGVPADSRDAFALLERGGFIGADLSKELQAMVGFRNTVVHEYQAINLAIVERVLDEKLKFLLEFTEHCLRST